MFRFDRSPCEPCSALFGRSFAELSTLETKCEVVPCAVAGSVAYAMLVAAELLLLLL